MILVSACLLGINCKYDGGNNLKPEIVELGKKTGLIPFCPEQLGGLSTPRMPAEITGGDGDDVLAGNARVIARDGTDVTAAFVRGAQEVLKMAALFGAGAAILKERSPSCGSNMIYDGSFNESKKPGAGVTAALLRSNGIKVYTEEELNLIEGYNCQDD